MPIDKMIPRFLVSDEDERLLKEGAMTDALNVTISEDGNGSEGVLKNVKGTTAITGATLGIGDDEVKVIGQVSDSQLGYIYFFVATVGENDHTHDAIYRVDTSASPNTTELVFKNTWLNFNENGFVKADVLNGAFQQDGVIQTILYFTDNKNAPRKINVDRALLGDYEGLSVAAMDLSLYTVRAPINEAPTFYFSSDPSIERNNFKKDFFQFATQVVYTDGESSALSPISKIAIPRSSYFDLMEEEGIGAAIYQDNVCNIDIHFNEYQFIESEVSKVNLFGRSGNNGNFFLIDSFNPFENLTRDLYGSSDVVFDSITNTYKFYNNVNGSAISDVLFNKLYDNVPLKAEGQAITSNRLFYSNYTEGFLNHDVLASITPVYSSIALDDNKYIDPATDSSNVISVDGTSVEINLVGGDAFGVGAGATTQVPFATEVTIEFDYDPVGSFTSTYNEPLNTGVPSLYTKVLGQDNEEWNVYAGYTGSDTTWDWLDSIPINGVTPNPRFSLNFSVTQDTDVSGLGEIIKDYLNGEVLSKTIQINSVKAVASNASNDYREGYFNGTAVIYFSLGDIVNHPAPNEAQNGHFLINMMVSRVDLGGCTFTDGQGNVRTILSDGDALQSTFSSGDQDLDYTITSFLSSQYAEAFGRQIGKTFKRGCTYDFGVVYYDEFGRSSFVNKIGSTYIKTENETTEKGPVSVNITFPGASNNAPSWASRYKIVYTEKGNYESFVQYTTGNAYPVRDLEATPVNNNHVIDTDKKQLYLSLKTLDYYTADKNPAREYSFTKGDKLRVISYDSSSTSTPNIVYPSANDNETEIIFDIVGVSIQGDTEDSNTIHDDAQLNHAIEEKYQGTFLILEAPQVAAGVSGVNATTGIRYTGFDWFSVSAAAPYPGESSNPSQLSYWGRRCVVEIISPSKLVSEKLYYDSGVSSKVGGRAGTANNHGIPTVLEGDVYFRPVRCKTPYVESNAWNVGTPKDWRYETIYLEASSITDSIISENWDKGRPYVFYENAAEVRRLNGITYSEAYAEDVANLSLSSFNPSLANFDSLDGRYGAINYIGNYNDDLVALQENKLCLIPVDKNILEYASGSADVTVSTNVLNQRRYSAGDYGCSNHPEAVLIQDNSVFFVDESRQAVCALTGGQLVPISDKSMSSFFENFFTNSHTKYVSGYDPRDNTYYLTGLGGTDETVGYDAARGVWQSRYSFIPDIYSNQNNMLFSAKYDEGDNLFWKHDSDTYNEFYGTGYPSQIQMVSKLSPSRVKVFNALSYEGDSALWDVSTNDIETDLGQTTGGITEWDEREGSYYASMPRNKKTDTIYTSKSTISLGTLTQESPGVYSSTLRLNRLPIPLGSPANVSVFVNNTQVAVTSVIGNVISFSGTPSVAGSATMTIAKQNYSSTEDSMRGHWMKIKMQNFDTTKHELYCINTHITDSKSHHPLGG